MSTPLNFGKYLINVAGFPEDIVAKALNCVSCYPDKSPGDLARYMVQELHMKHDEVFHALAKFYSFDELKLEPDQLTQIDIATNRGILAKFPNDLKNKLLCNKILPLKFQNGYEKDYLKVLASDPTNKMIHEISAQTSYKHIDIYWCRLAQLEALIETIYPQKNEYLKLLIEMGDELNEVELPKQELLEPILDDEINRGMLVNLFEGALVDAVHQNASDIHFVPCEKVGLDILFRIDGKLQTWRHLDNTLPEALTAVIKDRAVGVDRFERDTAQDGYAQRMIDDHLVRFRISVLPLASPDYYRRFESITIRVIDDRKVISDFQSLGFQKTAESEIIKALSSSQGMIILTGPTGSGKSTTLMTALHQLMNSGLNIITCEDPVEYMIAGARQLKISHKMDFEQALRCILRHDPDIVMVGEIRDRITADISIKLANTGHLTLTTLHTNDSVSAITRLYKMGVETFLLAYSINIIIGQRLVRKLCPFCRKPLSKDKWDTALQIGITQDDLEKGKIFEANGCPKCRQGYQGRISLAEALYLYPDIRSEIVHSGGEIDEERIRSLAINHGMKTMRECGLDRIKEGLTDINEVIFATSG